MLVYVQLDSCLSVLANIVWLEHMATRLSQDSKYISMTHHHDIELSQSLVAAVATVHIRMEPKQP